LARIVFRPARALDAALLLPTRLRTLDEDARLTRFEGAFALEARVFFFAFDFVVFFDLLRAAIINLSTRKLLRTRSKPVHEHCYRSVHEYCSSERQVDFLSTKSLASSPATPSNFRSTINLSFSTNSSKNQRGR